MELRPLTALFGLLALVSCGGQPGADTGTPGQVTAGDLPWIVSAAHPLAVEAGARVLGEGGSAVDAAIAVQAVLGLVEPQSSGLGGGAFMLHYDASSGTLTAYDGREHAPASVTPDVFLKDDGSPMGFFEAVLSGKAVGVPGVVAMLDMAHRDHGRLAWSELFTDAETLARDGFAMPGRLHDYLGRLRPFREDPQAAVFLDDDGAPLPVGARVRNPAYAETIRQLAEEGAQLFYTGAVAEAIITRVNERTGETTMTAEDFAAYRPVRRQAVCAVVALRKVCSMPPPSSGGITLLQIMQLFDMRSEAAAPEDDLLSYLEATRLAYADRGRFLGDPAAMGTDGVSADDLVDALISTDYLTGRLELIGAAPADTIPPGEPVPSRPLREGRIDGTPYELPSTSHFSIRDSAGNIVSMTTSVEMPFGSQMMAAGMVLNNQLTDFSRNPGEGAARAVNAPGPRKRPLSSMTPVIVFDAAGEPVTAIGSPGGPAIIGYVAKPLLDHLMSGRPLSETIIEPHVVIPRGSLLIETGGEELARRAEAIGYEVTVRDLSSGLYGFSVHDGEIDLAVDPRREGAALTGSLPADQ